jgi:signal transduction histidine kinase
LNDRNQDRTALETLARGLAHEIRTPLNVIAIDVRMLRELVSQSECPDSEKLDKICSRLERQVSHIANLLERFQDFARPGELELDKVVVAELLAAVADTVGQEAQARGVEINVSAADGLAVDVDKARFSQAILNLATNAIDAMESGGVLSMSGHSAGRDVVIEIGDSGPGIAEDLRNKIFDLFFSTKDTGTGLGLPIVQRTIHDHGGTIEQADSESGGSVFRIRLPAAGKGQDHSGGA